ncbi:unnamed protein product [Macrosiphum euphorbiae]|uniref:MYND-type domain-containing protein n=1 Tax=Macrosiphum euphorbiae TaxID=13131 RepID=A0AAV0WV00_9HEMI|nr:unnamed protein product [Macrosiphum euphorbiae]
MPYRSNKLTYIKKEVDSWFRNVVYDTCQVSLKKFTEEDIANYKLSLIKKEKKTPKEVGNIFKDNITIKQEYYTIKDNTTSKSDKRSKYEKKSKYVKTPKDTFKDFKTPKNVITSKNFKTPKDVKTSKGFKTPEDVKTSKDVKSSKVDKTYKDNTSIDDEPAKKKQKLDTNGIDVLKLVLSREGETHKFKSKFKSSLRPKKEIASTSTAEEVPIVIDCEESVLDCVSANSSATNVKQRVWVKDVKKMMDVDNYMRWQEMINYKNKPNHPTNGTKKLAVAKLPISGPISGSTSLPKLTVLKHAVNGKKYVKGHLVKIEKLYIKYFTKSAQDTVVVIANILNIISMSNKHHKARMDESFKKRSEAEKLKERCDANRLHGRHKQILETKLKNFVIDVVSSFETSEFDSAFQMFFLSILTVLRVLDQPKFKKGSIFKNLVLLLWNSLKNSEYNHPQIFSLFRSKTFRPDCIDLISLIEDSRDIDSGVTDRMSLFFVSSVNSREYFQAVIDAVIGDSNEDLGSLIDNAAFQCSINSKFKDPVASPTVQSSDNKIPATETIPSTVNNDEIIQHWFLAKNPDGTYQQIPVINGNKTQTIGNTAIKPKILTGQPLNNFYQSFSSSLQNKNLEPSTSKVIPTNKCFVVATTISHSPLVQVTASLSKSATTIPATTTTFVTFKPAVPNNISMVNGTLQRAEGSTILVGNRQYQLVKGPTGQMRAVINKAKTFIKPQPVAMDKCYARNCTKSATIMCSSCTSVKYCSHNCQRLDWYDSHINVCEQLVKQKQRP